VDGRDQAAHTLRPKTIEQYSYLIRLHIKPHLGTIKLDQLRPEQLQRLYSEKVASGLSPRTVQLIHAVIHKTLGQAVRWGLVMRNVSDLTDPPKPGKPIHHIWTVDQAKTFLASVKDHPWYPVYLIAVSTGLREGEVLGLHGADIDWAEGVMHIRRTVSQLQGKGGLKIGQPKTGKSRRSVTLPAMTFKALEPLKGTQGLLFITASGKPVAPRNLIRHFKLATAAAGLPDIRFHDLRHTCATLLLSLGVHPKVVQEILGHSSIALTMDTYSHVVPSMQASSASQMNDLLV
jgi:integrase